MSILKTLEPASTQDVVIYMPYYSRDKHKQLPYALALGQRGSLEGARWIEDGNSIPFCRHLGCHSSQITGWGNPLSTTI